MLPPAAPGLECGNLQGLFWNASRPMAPCSLFSLLTLFFKLISSTLLPGRDRVFKVRGCRDSQRTRTRTQCHRVIASETVMTIRCIIQKIWSNPSQ